MSSSTTHAAQHGATSPPTSLLSLPPELQARIITLACLSTVPVRHIETETTFSLMLVSRNIHAMAAAQLYRNLHITRASVLEKLQRTFVSRSALGQLVHSLHLGPDNHLPDHWWPMRYLVETPERDLSLREMTTSLTDKELLPRWCGPNRGWSLTDDRASRSRKDYHVLEAIEVASMSLDVDLRRPGRCISDESTTSREWLVGVIEAQAALDLYLLEMRRLEDKARYYAPFCNRQPFSTQGPDDDEENLPFYPPLVIASKTPSSLVAASKPSAVMGETFVLERKQLVEHLIKPKAVTDYLDHPLFASRSGVEVLTFAPDGQAKASQSFWPQMAKLYAEPPQASMVKKVNRPEPLSLSLYKYRTQNSSSAPAYPPTATAEGIVSLARSVLCATTRLQHLCLTGFLEQALCGGDALPAMPSLRTLSLGPSTLCHTGSLSPSPTVLWTLEKLFLLGHELGEHKVQAISGLPKLREVYWDLTHSSIEDVLSAITPLFHPASLTQSTEPINLKRSRSCFEDHGKGGLLSSSSSQRNPPLLQLSIHEDSEQAMRSALSPQALAAWDERRPISETPYRIEILVVSPPNSVAGDERWDVASEEVFHAYLEADDAFEYFLTGRWPWDCGPDSQVA